MNKTLELMERLSMLESNPFDGRGYKIKDHIVLSPKKIKQIETEGERIVGPRNYRLKDEKRRTITVFKHDDVHYGKIEHRGEHGHPLDVHYYTLSTKRKRKSKR